MPSIANTIGGNDATIPAGTDTIVGHDATIAATTDTIVGHDATIAATTDTTGGIAATTDTTDTTGGNDATIAATDTTGGNDATIAATDTTGGNDAAITAAPIAQAPTIAAVQQAVVACQLCPRLVNWRAETARLKRRMYRNETYWGRPLPAFGDPDARLLVVGLAPAAHGGNRTGRMFTGDRSGDWLFAALHRAGFASQPESDRIGDGQRLRGALITAAARCAPPQNRLTPSELTACRPYLAREIALLPDLRAVVALGRTAFDAFLRAWTAAGRTPPAPKPPFGHNRAAPLPDGGPLLIASYHPSQQNTQTGRLTTTMLDDVFRRARTAAAPTT